MSASQYNSLFADPDFRQAFRAFQQANASSTAPAPNPTAATSKRNVARSVVEMDLDATEDDGDEDDAGDEDMSDNEGRKGDDDGRKDDEDEDDDTDSNVSTHGKASNVDNFDFRKEGVGLDRKATSLSKQEQRRVLWTDDDVRMKVGRAKLGRRPGPKDKIHWYAADFLVDINGTTVPAELITQVQRCAQQAVNATLTPEAAGPVKKDQKLNFSFWRGNYMRFIRTVYSEIEAAYPFVGWAEGHYKSLKLIEFALKNRNQQVSKAEKMAKPTTSTAGSSSGSTSPSKPNSKLKTKTSPFKAQKSSPAKSPAAVLTSGKRGAAEALLDSNQAKRSKKSTKEAETMHEAPIELKTMRMTKTKSRLLVPASRHAAPRMRGLSAAPTSTAHLLLPRRAEGANPAKKASDTNKETNPSGTPPPTSGPLVTLPHSPQTHRQKATTSSMRVQSLSQLASATMAGLFSALRIRYSWIDKAEQDQIKAAIMHVQDSGVDAMTIDTSMDPGFDSWLTMMESIKILEQGGEENEGAARATEMMESWSYADFLPLRPTYGDKQTAFRLIAALLRLWCLSRDASDWYLYYANFERQAKEIFALIVAAFAPPRRSAKANSSREANTTAAADAEKNDVPSSSTAPASAPTESTDRGAQEPNTDKAFIKGGQKEAMLLLKQGMVNEIVLSSLIKEPVEALCKKGDLKVLKVMKVSQMKAEADLDRCIQGWGGRHHRGAGAASDQQGDDSWIYQSCDSRKGEGIDQRAEVSSVLRGTSYIA
ncbi:hypothetical protein CF335_g5946 [Tilletia laevis]|nr:hypothetical protein CF335_g5946 [Tilletia laevis]